MSCQLRPMQFKLTLVAVIVVVVFAGLAESEIIYEKKVGDKTVMCMHTGLFSDLKDCGGQINWYTYVFVGSIASITPIANDEKKIEIIPEEVFHGRPTNPLYVQTSQAACLPDLTVGDRWLFFLRKEDGKPIVLDYYGNGSLPVADAQEQIETLRRLETIGNYGIVRGKVVRSTYFEGKGVPDAHVVARHASSNSQFVAVTDAHGEYEFPPLLPGEYKLTVDPVGSFLADDNGVDVLSGTCWDVTFSRSPHAEIGGHLQRSDGSPAYQVGVLISNEDGSLWITETTDEHGRFHIDSLQAGKYVIGINLRDAPTWKHTSGGGPAGSAPIAPYYYPGVRDRSAALVITLATDEKRDDIDVVVPTQ